jgi:hypothetical protein
LAIRATPRVDNFPPELFSTGKTSACAAKLKIMIGNTTPNPLGSHIFVPSGFLVEPLDGRSESTRRHNAKRNVVAKPMFTTLPMLFSVLTSVVSGKNTPNATPYMTRSRDGSVPGGNIPLAVAVKKLSPTMFTYATTTPSIKALMLHRTTVLPRDPNKALAKSS